MLNAWTLNDAAKKKVQRRASMCRGEVDFVDSRGVRLYDATGAVKANDWIKITKGVLTIIIL